MKLYRVSTFTGTDSLELRAEPDPPAPVARQALVRIRATSLNFRDLLAVDGAFQGPPPGLAPNHIPLCDGAGEVVAVGKDVTRIKPGDRVALTYHAGWIAGPTPHDLNALGRSSGLNDGTLTEYTIVDESEAVIFPEHLSYDEAATLPCAGVTAWYALHGQAPLMAGDDVLVMGTGGVSVFALQFAKVAGARVIATTTSPGKIDSLRQMGADVVIDASAGQGWHRDVLDATAGRGVDVTVEIGGAGTWKDSIAATRANGRMSIVGALDGSRDNMPQAFMMRGVNLNPTRVGSRAHFEQMNRAISANGIRPVLDRIFPFADARFAFEHFRSGPRIGKVIIHVD